jgi:hypothetical protein
MKLGRRPRGREMDEDFSVDVVRDSPVSKPKVAVWHKLGRENCHLWGDFVLIPFLTFPGPFVVEGDSGTS